MFKIEKIVTARNTAFIEGYPKDLSENSPRVTEIVSYTEGDLNRPIEYHVEYGDGTTIIVKDVVEIWNRPATAEEEVRMKNIWAELP